MHNRIYFASDLHLFARHSQAARYAAVIGRAAAQARVFVLGGDIFDFRWSTLESTGATVAAAIDWLSRLAAEHPRCHFHYLLGNHDYNRGLMAALAELELAAANFSWHLYYLRMGSSVFLHGDVADRFMTAERLTKTRSRWLHARRPGRLRRHVYDLVLRAGLHRPVPLLVHRKRRVAKRILAYLEDIREGPKNGVRNIYFGHTHRRVCGYRYGGLAFHNGGAPIRGMGFHLVEVVLS
ncbi:MAG: metallophosphoesterase [Thermoguttaceae bacterium]|jgi:UDP-2,3-diacylglucosamine hydrolase